MVALLALDWTRFLASASSSASMSTIHTSSPFPAKNSEAARPIPLLAPVTTATLPAFNRDENDMMTREALQLVVCWAEDRTKEAAWEVA